MPGGNKRSYAKCCRFVQIRVAFLLPPGIEGLNTLIIHVYVFDGLPLFSYFIKHAQGSLRQPLY